MVFKFSGHTDTVTALLLDSDKSAVGLLVHLGALMHIPFTRAIH